MLFLDIDNIFSFIITVSSFFPAGYDISFKFSFSTKQSSKEIYVVFSLLTLIVSKLVFPQRALLYILLVYFFIYVLVSFDLLYQYKI